MGKTIVPSRILLFPGPVVVSDVEIAFGPRSIKEMIPIYEYIPNEFKSDSNRWVKFFDEWFFHGLPGDTEFVPKPDFDATRALRHIQAVMRSREPKHEHKTAGVAFLLNEWFENVKDSTGKSLI